MDVGLLDTSLHSENDGDQIIVSSIQQLFPELLGLPRIPTHQKLDANDRHRASTLDGLVVTGTNLLSADIYRLKQWPLDRRSVRSLEGRLIFLGVGWWQYQGRIKRRTVRALRRLTNDTVPIAARDSYTSSRLNEIGVENLNTGCPTMWNLPTELPALGGSSEVVFTLTNYNSKKATDERIVAHLAQRYNRVHIWPQSDQDRLLLDSMSLPKNAEVSGRGLTHLDEILKGRDYVGTRLHAGVRAAQLGRPALVLAVDNRAVEIGRDTGFPTVRRDDGLEAIDKGFEQASTPTALRLPHDAIETWTNLFRQWFNASSESRGS
jgi:polysaccharide pyruvyl transferase WcaK-like protein